MRWQNRFSFLAVLVCVGGSALADIRATPHSLVRSNGQAIKTDDQQVCVFCHTPAIGASSAPLRPPQWQPSLALDYTFPIYDDIGRLGLDRVSVGSQSIACLSCHDSNQALSASKTSFDHPFGVPYRGATKGRIRSPNAAPAHSAEAPPHVHAKKLVALEDFRDPSQGIIENRTVWWVSSQGQTARRSRNDLPLYPRIDDDTGDELPHIECSSCHDPHSPNQLFLRTDNQGSALCLTCHNK